MRTDRRAAHIGIASEDGGDLRLTLFGFEGAGTVNDDAARLGQRDRLVEEFGLQLDEEGEIARPLGPGNVGVAANSAGGAAGRIDKRGVERRRLEGERVGDDDLGVEPEALEVLCEHFQPFGRTVDGRHRRAGRGEFGALSAGRSAEIDDACAGVRLDQACRQGGGGVLHPPLALGVALEFGDGFVGVEADRAGRQHDPAKPFRPDFRVALDADVERRLASVGRGDCLRRRLAERLAPPGREPGRRVVVERIGDGQDHLPVARDAAQDRVDEAGEGSARRVRPRRPHREVDRRVVGRVEEEDLRRTSDERPLQHAAALRHALVQLLRQRLADGAEPAKGDSGDRAGERRIAWIETDVAQRQVGGEAFLERPRLRHGLHDRPRRRYARNHAGRRRLGRVGPADLKSALLSSQTRLASNYHRPLCSSLYAISEAGLRQAVARPRADDFFLADLVFQPLETA